jgi:Protein of unknown function (DUF3558)
VPRFLLLTVVTAGVALAAAGCGGAAGGTPSPATDTGAAATTTSATPSFDPCAAVPADGLAKLGITDQAKIDPDTNACTWKSASFVVTAHVNRYAVGQRPDNGFAPKLTPFTIGSRKAEVWRSDVGLACAVDIALGTASYSVDVVPVDSNGLDQACASAKSLATGAEPKLPTS